MDRAFFILMYNKWWIKKFNARENRVFSPSMTRLPGKEASQCILSNCCSCIITWQESSPYFVYVNIQKPATAYVTLISKRGRNKASLHTQTFGWIDFKLNHRRFNVWFRAKEIQCVIWQDGRWFDYPCHCQQFPCMWWVFKLFLNLYLWPLHC